MVRLKAIECSRRGACSLVAPLHGRWRYINRNHSIWNLLLCVIIDIMWTGSSLCRGRSKAAWFWNSISRILLLVFCYSSVSPFEFRSSLWFLFVFSLFFLSLFFGWVGRGGVCWSQNSLQIRSRIQFMETSPTILNLFFPPQFESFWLVGACLK